MFDDSQFGKRNKRGDWQPDSPASYPPVFVWPLRPVAGIKWLLTHYLFPWNTLYALIAVVTLYFLTPAIAQMKTLSLGWVLVLLARNAALTLVFYGLLHAWFYIYKRQGQIFKFNGKWPSLDNPTFAFKRQTADNILWTFISGVPIWTAFEAMTLWAMASGWVPYVSWEAHPFYCFFILLCIPAFRDLHFYVVHRLLHWPPLYNAIHKLHHNNVNPGPWSGLSMHPVEHLFYFSGVLIHLLVPSHPFHVVFHMVHLGLAPAQGHLGFERVVIKGRLVDVGDYPHYLHHKYFECNYADGVIPLDKWFGTFHDGSKEGQEAMDRRFQVRAQAVNAKQKTKNKKAGGSNGILD